MTSKIYKIVVINLLFLLGLNTACLLLARAVPRVRALFATGKPLADDRWTLPNYDDPDYAYKIFQEWRGLTTEYRPYLGWSRVPFDGETTHINAQGDRQHRPPREVGDDAPIARFFGGSTMWGTGVDDEGTIPGVFNDQNPEYRVFNHGETAFNTRQSLARLINLYSQGERADLVVFYDGIADVSHFCRPEISLVGHSLEDRMRRRVAGERGAEKYVNALYVLFFEGIFDFFQTLKGEKAESAHYYCSTDPERARQVARTIVSNWTIAHDLVIARGGRFIGILQPVSYVGHPRVDHIPEEYERRLPLGEQLRAVYPYVREDMAPYPYLYDWSASYDGNEYIYNDFAHVSRNGNEIIARSVSALLLR